MRTPHGCSNGVGVGAPLPGTGTRPSRAGAPGGHSCPSPAFQPPEEPDEEAGAAEARRKREDRGMAEWSTGALLRPVFGVLLIGSFVEVAQSSFQRPWTSVVPSRRVPHRRATCLSRRRQCLSRSPRPGDPVRVQIAPADHLCIGSACKDHLVELPSASVCTDVSTAVLHGSDRALVTQKER